MCLFLALPSHALPACSTRLEPHPPKPQPDWTAPPASLFRAFTLTIDLNATNYHLHYYPLELRWEQLRINEGFRVRAAWGTLGLNWGHAEALANTIDWSTHQSYSSALNPWMEMHRFSLEPNLETIFFFIVYMSHQINPRSVKIYLSTTTRTQVSYHL